MAGKGKNAALSEIRIQVNDKQRPFSGNAEKGQEVS
jgi:hypothetical protein